MSVTPAAAAPAAVEYLPSGMRDTCRTTTPADTPLPAGTTGREASHAGPKLWFGSTHKFHAGHFKLVLSVFTVSKVLGRVTVVGARVVKIAASAGGDPRARVS